MYQYVTLLSLVPPEVGKTDGSCSKIVQGNV